MSFLSCKYFSRVVKLAGLFFVSGMLLEAIAHLMVNHIILLFIQPVALAMVLISPAIILMATIIALLSGNALKDCID